jgi:hypothetical protein
MSDIEPLTIYILSDAMHFQCTICLAEETVSTGPTAGASLV